MGRGREQKPKREPNIKMSSGMEIDDATTLWSGSESSFSDSPDPSPKRNGHK